MQPTVCAIAAFGIPVRYVGDLMNALHGSVAEPARWFVFACDVDELEALNEAWIEATDVTLSVIPAARPDVVNAALQILRHEAIAFDRCVWLHDAGTGSAPPASAGFAMALQVDGSSAPGVLAATLRDRIAPASSW